MGVGSSGAGGGSFNLRRIQELIRERIEGPARSREEEERLRRLRLLQGGIPFGTQQVGQPFSRKTLLGQ